MKRTFHIAGREEHFNEQLNQFIEDTEGDGDKILDIKYSSAYNVYKCEIIFSALIEYEKPGALRKPFEVTKTPSV